MPEVLRLSEGNFWVDYGYHLAPIEGRHVDEMGLLLDDWGVPSFKIFMFYGGYGLHGRSDAQNEFLMIGPEDRYDVAHFEFIMRSARAADGRAPGPRRLHQREPALRVRRHPHCLHEARRAERQARRARRVQRRAAAALRGTRDLDRRVPRLRDRLPQHQPAAPLVEEGDGRRADDAGRLPAHQLQARGDRRPPPARHRLRLRRARQGESADPPARGRRGALAGGARARRRLDRERPRVLLDRAEVQREIPEEHLARQVGLRRDRIPPLRRTQRRIETRHVLQPHGGAPLVEPRAALRRPAERRHRARLRRRPRARGPARVVRRPRGRVGVEAGLHAVRRNGADRPRQDHVPARRARLRPRELRGAGARQIHPASDQGVR